MWLELGILRGAALGDLAAAKRAFAEALAADARIRLDPVEVTPELVDAFAETERELRRR